MMMLIIGKVERVMIVSFAETAAEFREEVIRELQDRIEEIDASGHGLDEARREVVDLLTYFESVRFPSETKEKR